MKVEVTLTHDDVLMAIGNYVRDNFESDESILNVDLKIESIWADNAVVNQNYSCIVGLDNRGGNTLNTRESRRWKPVIKDGM